MDGIIIMHGGGKEKDKKRRIVRFLLFSETRRQSAGNDTRFTFIIHIKYGKCMNFLLHCRAFFAGKEKAASRTEEAGRVKFSGVRRHFPGNRRADVRKGSAGRGLPEGRRDPSGCGGGVSAEHPPGRNSRKPPGAGGSKRAATSGGGRGRIVSPGRTERRKEVRSGDQKISEKSQTPRA